MIIVSSCIFIILVLGIYEKYMHQKNVNSINTRILVNGIRGKSTVTRLITGILKESGYKVIGKTTGTAARMIYWNTEEEKPIQRKRAGVNISEQVKVIKAVAEAGAEAFVSECMAVHPDYQIVLQEKMVQANIVVIVNVLEDHMDVMGPTLDQVAQAFAATIPYNGHLIVSEGPYVEYFREEAEKRGTKLIVACDDCVSEEFIERFDYVIFPQNISLAMAVAEALHIDEETAEAGMLKSQPDPGVLRIMNIRDDRNPMYFVNGFAANDAASTRAIWERIKELNYPTEEAVVIMNCRYDRVDRTEQFARDVFPYIEAEALIVIGDSTKPIVDAFEAGQFPIKRLLRLEGKTPAEINDNIQAFTSSEMVFGVGNIHGAGEPLVELFEELGRNRHGKMRIPDIARVAVAEEIAIG